MALMAFKASIVVLDVVHVDYAVSMFVLLSILTMIIMLSMLSMFAKLLVMCLLLCTLL
eukprot:JP442777.1.p1 GENE.JP442777.1~~JP442777.1.p1  ORF type:complete len:58 (-),score=1.87 JP442777.1:77-250(-)